MEKIEICIRYVPDRLNSEQSQLTIVQTLTLEAYLSVNSEVLEYAARNAIREFSKELDIELETERYNPKRSSMLYYTPTFKYDTRKIF